MIVLLSDGENNVNPDPVAAAQAAADQGIRIETVGIGSPEGTTLDINGFRVHTQLNEDLLQQIARHRPTARTTAAADATDLQAVYDNLERSLVVKPEPIEVTALFAGGRSCLLAVGGLLVAALAGAASCDAPGCWRRVTLPWPTPRCSSPAAAGRRSTSGRCDAGGRSRPAIRASSLIRAACPRSSRLRRHLPFALFALALGALVARAGPAGRHPGGAHRPDARSSSRSTCRGACAPPTSRRRRLQAAEDAAAGFIQRRSARSQIGIVAFCGFAESIQPPTTRPARSCSTRVQSLDDRPPDGDRQRHPRVDRRDRRDRPVRRARA